MPGGVQRRHWYEYEVGDPVQVPACATSVCPTWLPPWMTGSVFAFGAVATGAPELETARVGADEADAVPAGVTAPTRMTRACPTSGVVGVRLVHAVRRREDKEYPDWRWIAFWPGCPNSGGIGWSVNKYGDERAFVLACLARKLETVERDAIDEEYEVFRASRDYRRLLKLKQITPA